MTAPMREQLRSSLAGALRRRLDSSSEQADSVDERVAMARRLVEIDEWSASSHLQLIDALEAAGDATGARVARERLSDLDIA